MADRKSFIVYIDNTEYMDILSDEQLGQLYRAQVQYAKGIEPEIDDITVKALFSIIKGQLDRDNEKYQKKVDRMNRVNENRNNDIVKTDNDIDTISSRNRHDIVGDTVTDTVTDTDINTKKESKEKRFARPTLEEVQDHIREKGYHFDAESFIAFYDSKGWKVGNQPMKNWKSACVTWEKRQAKAPPGNKFHNFAERQTDMDSSVMDNFSKMMGD